MLIQSHASDDDQPLDLSYAATLQGTINNLEALYEKLQNGEDHFYDDNATRFIINLGMLGFFLHSDKSAICSFISAPKFQKAPESSTIPPANPKTILRWLRSSRTILRIFGPDTWALRSGTSDLRGLLTVFKRPTEVEAFFKVNGYRKKFGLSDF